jgi:hypothetical protein
LSTLAIPEKYREGFATLLAISDADVGVIADALENTPPSASTKRLSVSVSKAFSGFTKEQVHEAVAALRSLYAVYANSDKPLADFLKELLPALQEISGSSILGPKRKGVVNRFQQLLGVQRVAVYARTKALAKSGEASFCKANINSDLRPVFIGGEDRPQGFILIHRLQLGFHTDDGEHKDFFLTLDDEDLQTLREAIERSEQKVKGLRKSVESFTF